MTSPRRDGEPINKSKIKKIPGNQIKSKCGIIRELDDIFSDIKKVKLIKNTLFDFQIRTIYSIFDAASKDAKYYPSDAQIQWMVKMRDLLNKKTFK